MFIDDELFDLESFKEAFPQIGENEIPSFSEKHGLQKEGELTYVGEFLFKKSDFRPYAYENNDNFVDYYYLNFPFVSRLGCILEVGKFAKRAKTYEDRSNILSPIYYNLEPEMMKTAMAFSLLHCNKKGDVLLYKHTENGAIFNYPSRNVKDELKCVPELLYELGVLKNKPYAYINLCITKARIKNYSTYGNGRLFFPHGMSLNEMNPFSIPINKKEREIMEIVRFSGSISRKTVVDKLKMSSQLASYYLNSLFKKELLKRVGLPRSKSCYYLPTQKCFIDVNL